MDTSTPIGTTYQTLELQSILQHGSEQIGESQGKGTVIHTWMITQL